MAVELADYVASLRREVTPLGATLPTTVTTSELIGYLADAFWEARLDGFCEGYAADEDGVIDPITPDGSVDPTGGDIGREQIALLIVYAGVRILRTQVLNTRSQFRAKAGPVEYEEQNGATMLAEALRQLSATKSRLQQQATSDKELSQVYGFDALSARLFEPGSYSGSTELIG